VTISTTGPIFSIGEGARFTWENCALQYSPALIAAKEQPSLLLESITLGANTVVTLRGTRFYKTCKVRVRMSAARQA
jgi:hypothetical protein